MAASAQQVQEALRRCATDSDAVIDADLTIFFPDANFDRVTAIKQLVLSFGLGDEEHPKVQKISFEIYCAKRGD